MRGKPVLVVFWATWCPACVKETPYIKDYYERFHDEGLEIVGVSLDTDRHKLAEFVNARNGLVRDRTALKNRQKNLTIAVLKRQCTQRLDQIARHIENLDAEIARLIAADPTLARRHEIIASIDGLGTITANQLVATMPELGSLDNKQAASLAGLAPVARQSGQWKGKSFIQGGRANVRQALYMPALVAARFNPDLKARYEQLIARGKPAKIAITAVMRKLIVTANALLKADRTWLKSIA